MLTLREASAPPEDDERAKRGRDDAPATTRRRRALCSLDPRLTAREGWKETAGRAVRSEVEREVAGAMCADSWARGRQRPPGSPAKNYPAAGSPAGTRPPFGRCRLREHLMATGRAHIRAASSATRASARATRARRTCGAGARRAATRRQRDEAAEQTSARGDERAIRMPRRGGLRAPTSNLR